MEDEEYLEEGFDPKTLKVAQLKEILNDKNVSIPSNVKKAQLVELFNREVKSATPDAAEASKKFESAETKSEDSEEKHKKKKTSRKAKVAKESELEVTENSGKESINSDSKAEGGAVPDVKTPSKITPSKKTPSKSIKAESPASEASVKSPSSAKKRKSEGPTSKEKRTKADESLTNEKSPKTIKKPKAKSPSVRSPRSPKLEQHKAPLSPLKKTKPKSIFDEDDDDELLGLVPKSVKTPVKSEKPNTPIKSTQKTVSSASIKKESASKIKKTTPKSPTTPSIRTAVKSATTSTRKKSPKAASIVNSPTGSKDVTNNSFRTVEEEVQNFDQELQRIKNKETASIDMALASELGIAVQGLAPVIATPRIESSSTSKKSPESHHHILTPKPRLVPINQQINELIEEQDDVEEEDDEEIKVEIDAHGEEEEEVELESHPEQVKVNRPLTPVLFTFFTWIVIVSAGLFGYWYREQTFLSGYCGQEIDKPTFPYADNVILKTIGNYLDANFKPECVPCPSHARCFPYLELGCFEDFIEFKPWDNFLKPYNKKCIPDSKKAEKLEIMIDVALDLLRSKNANVQCGQSTNNEEAGIELGDLHDLLLSMKAPYITIEEFEELWQRSIIELEKEPEVIKGYSSVPLPEFVANSNHTDEDQNTNKVLRSASLSNLSLKCQIQNSVVGSLVKYKYRIIVFVAIFLVVKYVQYRYQVHRTEKLKVDIIYKEVIHKLQHQAKLSSQVRGKINAYIGANQLRDLILANEHNLKRRINLWQQVVGKVDQNTNITSQLIEDHGEIMNVWQWISEL
ncbi:Spliced mRNA and Cell cycle regulated gene [Scheffersomyces stipitis CBS 6054]|uniref:Spliced mRNA and Cell cycle regulated protein n=1 Tax=Scheffersomyces stipitis (strain ATCC 58785 / CBS 6054 / NBRC 10063 / NRRL Y-11545) TaxID=322104 RepID=A3LRI9_PICST|nr:Spliced mRNA and Cell cycle regulated gene [Scheffersomyces stipitis CBS 6054]ABN65394.2 Spliced mRNA and Cell cycle regulated gene [Scheffersomyces stipitis CBS 6054]